MALQLQMYTTMMVLFECLDLRTPTRIHLHITARGSVDNCSIGILEVSTWPIQLVVRHRS